MGAGKRIFDSVGGEQSLVKLLTNVVSGKTLEVPRPIRVILRKYTMPGINLPVYSLTDHLFLMCDATAGDIDLFGGEYHATFDGDIFDSNYTRVEGISTGDIVLTIKKNQPVWPEWIDEDEAETIDGKKFVLKDGQWVELKEDDPAAHAAVPAFEAA